MPTTVIILAAGQGKRMHSDLPKVLHPLAGRPLLQHVVAAATTLKPREIRVVHGYGGGQVQAAFLGQPIHWFHQAVQKGTGHAVQQALLKIPAGDVALILYGDVPLVPPAMLKKLLIRAAKGQVAVLTAEMADPTGYGRILRGRRGGITAIVEEADATREQRQIREINTGLIACPAGRLSRWIGRLKPNNAQKEYYLTDIIGLAVKDKVPVAAVRAGSEDEVLGINDKAQLAAAEKILRRRLTGELLAAGVTLTDPERVDIRGEVVCGRDVVIDADVILEGVVHIGDGARIGAFTLIRNTLVGAGTALIGADDDDAPPSSPMRLTAAGFSFSMAIARLLATIGAIGGSLSGATAGPVALDPTFSVWDVPAAADSPAPAAPNAFAVPDAAGVPGVTSSSREIRA